MKYFLLTYNRHTGVGKVERVFADTQRSEAIRSRFALESNQAKDVEVVVLGAESETDLRRTHARYFSTTADLIADAGTLVHA